MFRHMQLPFFFNHFPAILQNKGDYTKQNAMIVSAHLKLGFLLGSERQYKRKHIFEEPKPPSFFGPTL